MFWMSLYGAYEKGFYNIMLQIKLGEWRNVYIFENKQNKKVYWVLKKSEKNSQCL